MPKESPKLSAQATPPEIRVKRELWVNGLHSVARLNGRWVATRKWHTKKDTGIIKDIVVHIESFPETYKPKKRKEKPKPSFAFKITGIRPEKFVYLMQSHFGKEYRCYSMTSSQLYTMNSNVKEYLFDVTKRAYIEEFKYPNEDHFDNLRLIKIYNSHTMETLRSY